MKNNQKVLKMILAAFFLALAYVLPYATAQLQQLGQMLCPMHIPILLCGFICGWQWGLIVGFTAPLFRSAIAGMPVMFPGAFAMAFELAAYGAIAGLLFRFLPKKRINLYLSLLISMISGRIIWGIAMLLFTRIKGTPFTFSAFLSGAVLNSLPGIGIQIILVPIIVIVIERFTKINKVKNDEQ